MKIRMTKLGRAARSQMVARVRMIQVRARRAPKAPAPRRRLGPRPVAAPWMD